MAAHDLHAEKTEEWEMKKILLVCLTIPIFFAAHAENWKNKINQPPLAATQRGIPVCLSNANCWRPSKRALLLSMRKQ